MKINKELLKGLIGDYESDDRFQVVENQISHTSRWSIHYDCTIKDKTTHKYYDASYKEGATESQDESPFEYDEPDSDGNLTLSEVEPYEVIVTRYRKVKNE
jgi:hypothetical protein